MVRIKKVFEYSVEFPETDENSTDLEKFLRAVHLVNFRDYPLDNHAVESEHYHDLIHQFKVCYKNDIKGDPGDLVNEYIMGIYHYEVVHLSNKLGDILLDITDTCKHSILKEEGKYFIFFETSDSRNNRMMIRNVLDKLEDFGYKSYHIEYDHQTPIFNVICIEENGSLNESLSSVDDINDYLLPLTDDGFQCRIVDSHGVINLNLSKKLDQYTINNEKVKKLVKEYLINLNSFYRKLSFEDLNIQCYIKMSMEYDIETFRLFDIDINESQNDTVIVDIDEYYDFDNSEQDDIDDTSAIMHIDICVF